MQLRFVGAVLAGVAALWSWAPTQAAPPQAPAASRPLAPAPAAQMAPAQASTGAHALDAVDLEAWLDGLVPFQLKNGDIAGMQIAVVKDGKVLLQKGYGYADVARRIPMDPARTVIRPGSTSKLFTWTAVMQLVQAGKLDLDRDVNAYLDFKIPQKFNRPITLRDLMNHRAGFEEGLKSVLTTDPKALLSNADYLKTHPRPLLFPPGQVPAYSNYGAALAGYIVERVSGEPFDRYVERHIFQPLGMMHSTFTQPLPAALQPAMAKGYRTASGPPQPFELVTTQPAGSMTGTEEDLARFMIAQLQGGQFNGAQILSPGTTALMHTPTNTGLPGFAVMAHGFFRQIHNGHVTLGHGGDTVIFHTELELIPDANVGIVYTYTSRGAGDSVYGAREALFTGFMDRYFPAPAGPPPKALATAAQDAAQIVGSYQGSRRVEHGFISVFYLLQQTQITANADGTINAPGPAGRGTVRFQEVAPKLWREVGGERQLALTEVAGVKTVVDSDDPSGVLQAGSVWRSAGLNLTILVGAFLVLAWTLILWPLSWLLRRGDRAAIGVEPEVRRTRVLARIAAAVDLVYLVGWIVVLQPIMAIQVQFYGPQLDGVLRALQVLGLVVVAAAAVGLWNVWRTFRLKAPWPSRIWSLLQAAALLGVVWIGLAGQLMSFNLNY